MRQNFICRFKSGGPINYNILAAIQIGDTFPDLNIKDFNGGVISIFYGILSIYYVIYSGLKKHRQKLILWEKTKYIIIEVCALNIPVCQKPNYRITVLHPRINGGKNG